MALLLQRSHTALTRGMSSLVLRSSAKASLCRLGNISPASSTFGACTSSSTKACGGKHGHGSLLSGPCCACMHSKCSKSGGRLRQLERRVSATARRKKGACQRAVAGRALVIPHLPLYGCQAGCCGYQELLGLDLGRLGYPEPAYSRAARHYPGQLGGRVAWLESQRAGQVGEGGRQAAAHRGAAQPASGCRRGCRRPGAPGGTRKAPRAPGAFGTG